MGEIAQANFRVDTDTAEAFRKLAKEKGMTQAQFLDHLMQALTLQEAKTELVDRLTEIEDFERLTKGIVEAYTYSLKLCKTAEERVADKYDSDIRSYKETIKSLQAQVESLKTDKNILMNDNSAAQEQRDRAVKEAEEAKKLAEQTTKTNAMLEGKLTEAEEALKDYKAVKAQEKAFKDAVEKAEKALTDAQKESEINRIQTEAAHEKALREQESRLKGEAEKAEKEHRAIEDALKADKAALKDEISKYKADLKDAEIEHVKAVAALEKEVAALKAKVEVLSVKL